MKIVDNFLPKKEFKEISEILMSNDFPYFFNNSIADSSEEKKSNMFYFIHNLYMNNSPRSDWYPLINKYILSKLTVFSLLRMKVNCYPRTEKRIVHGRHVDFFNHKGSVKGLVFSLNTCNGATILEDGKEVKSVANRALFFDSMKPHSSTSCTDKKARFNININYL